MVYSVIPGSQGSQSSEDFQVGKEMHLRDLRRKNLFRIKSTKIGYIRCILIACLQVWKLSKERKGTSFFVNYHKSIGIDPSATLCKATHQLVNKEQQLWGKHDPSILKIAPKIKYQTYCTPIFSSVRSSDSHPDQLLTQHQPPHFFRSHRSSTTTWTLWAIWGWLGHYFGKTWQDSGIL